MAVTDGAGDGAHDDGAAHGDDPNGEGGVARLLDTENLADALESDRFRQFLDHMPFAVAVAVLGRPERIVYALSLIHI